MTAATFLDSVYAGCFKVDPAGRTIYFPNGAVGAGYVVPDEARLASIKQKQRVMFLVTVVGASALAPLAVRVLETLDLWLAIVIGIAALAAVSYLAALFAKSLAKGLEKSEVDLKFSEAVSGQAKALPPWFLKFQLVFWSLGLIGGTAMIITAATMGQTLFGWLAFASSAGLLTLAVLSWRAKSAA